MGKIACNEATGKCLCLHNGWRRATEDDSSRRDRSSVFDFDGDGAAEVIYNDECRFRVFTDQRRPVARAFGESARVIEYPIVVDVDNDGNAEIVFATTTESGFCSENLDAQYNAGIEVWLAICKIDCGLSARRLEPARVPRHQRDGGVRFRCTSRRAETIQRSRLQHVSLNPRSFGVAPGS